MVMLRMLAFRPSTYAPQEGVGQDQHQQISKQTVQSRSNETNASPAMFIDGTVDISEPISQKEYCTDWSEMIKVMKLGGITRELANNCVLDSIDDKQCLLLLNSSHKQLLSPRTEERLLKALQSYRGKPIKLSVKVATAENETPAMQINQELQNRHQAAEQSIENDENIQALKDQLGARVVPGSIKPR
jgi:DNA polymerase-3 subunit gamma/tau